MATRTRRINFYINNKVVTNDIKSIEKAVKDLRSQIKFLEFDSHQYQLRMAEIKRLNRIVYEHNQALSATRYNLFTLKGLANAFNKYWPMIMGTIGTIVGTITGIKRTVEAYAELEDKMSDVMKTTGLTREQVGWLNEEFKKIDTRSTKNELFELARVAGKLGITSREEVLGFVKASDKIVIALKKDLGGSAEEAVNVIGKLVEVFELREKFGIEEALIRVGSAINVLGMSSAANEQHIVSFTKRAAGVGKTSEITIPNILGIAAASDALALSTEVASTAYTQLMGRIAKDTATFATIAGMKLEDFIEIYDKDANEAMLKVLEGLNKNADGFRGLANAMDGASMDGEKAISVISTLANKVDFVRQQQELATIAFDEGTSVIEEFNIKNENAQAILEKQRKNLRNIVEELGQSLTPAYIESTKATAWFLNILRELIPWFFRNISSILSLVSAIVAYRTAISVTHLLQKQFTASLIFGKGVVLLFAAAYYKLTGDIKKAAAAMRLFNIISKGSFWGILAGTIAAVASALTVYISFKKKATVAQKAFNEVQKQTNDRMAEEGQRLEMLFERIKRTLPNSAKRNELVKELNAQYPDLIKNINLEELGTQKLEEAKQKYLEKLREQLYVESLIQKKAELTKKLQELNENQNNPPFWKSLNPYYFSNIKKEIAETSDALKTLDENISFEIDKSAYGENIAYMMAELNKYKEALAAFKAGKDYQLGTLKIKADDENNLDYLERSIKNIELKIKAVKKEQEELSKGPPATLEPVTEEWFFRKRKELQEKYQRGAIKDFEEYEKKLLEIEIEYIKQQLANNNLNAEDRFKLENDLFEKLYKEKRSAGKKLTDQDIELYKEKDRITKQYLNNELRSEEEYNDLILQAEIDHYTRLLQQQDMDMTERWRNQEKLNELLVKQEREKLKRIEALRDAVSSEDPIEKERREYEKRLSDLGFYIGQKEFISDLHRLAYEAEERKHQQALNEIDAKLLDERLELMTSTFKLELAEMKARHTEEMKMSGTNRAERRRLRVSQSREERAFVETWANEIMSIIQQFKDTGVFKDLMLSDEMISPEELEKLDEKLRYIYELLGNTKEKIEREFSPAGNQSFFGFSFNDLENFLARIDDFESLDKLEEKVQVIAMGFMMLGNAAKEYFNLLKSYEQIAYERSVRDTEKRKESLNKQYEMGLISRENYDNQIAKLDKELERKKIEMDRREARRNKAMALFDATINGAVAIVKGYAKSLAMGILISALVATQLGLIAATPLPELPGAETGGYLVQRAQDGKSFKAKNSPDKRGWIRKPTVLVSENGEEYVVPADGVRNPTLRPIIDLIETQRRQNKLSNVNFSELLYRRIHAGKASGGSVTPKTSAPTGAYTAMSTDLVLLIQENTKAINELRQILKAPIKADVSLYGQKGLYRSMEIDEAIRENANF